VVEPFQGKEPVVGANVYIAETARVIGEVELADGVSIWEFAVIRGDMFGIRIGELSNIQDLCICHTTNGGPPVIVGHRVTVGHRAILHSCTIEDSCLIGMGAILLDGVRVGSGSIVAAGSVLLEGFQVPPRSLVAGVPATVKKTISEAAMERIGRKAEEYHRLALAYLGRAPYVAKG
jgi:carbonic anhydrase/acetyltransferase-like protein (isoleucine patch superfamily)